MNVRVQRAVSDIDGLTGMAILRAIAGGERDGLKLAKLRDRRCSKTEQEIAEQLSGHWRRSLVQLAYWTPICALIPTLPSSLSLSRPLAKLEHCAKSRVGGVFISR
jgi:hypothetical protein